MIDVALDVPRYEGIINGALGQREKIERYADELHNKGFKTSFSSVWGHLRPLHIFAVHRGKPLYPGFLRSYRC